MKKKRQEEKLLGAYETLALSDEKYRNAETGTTIPSDMAVKEAKDWVDANHK